MRPKSLQPAVRVTLPVKQAQGVSPLTIPPKSAPAVMRSVASECPSLRRRIGPMNPGFGPLKGNHQLDEKKQQGHSVFSCPAYRTSISHQMFGPGTPAGVCVFLPPSPRAMSERDPRHPPPQADWSLTLGLRFASPGSRAVGGTGRHALHLAQASNQRVVSSGFLELVGTAFFFFRPGGGGGVKRKAFLCLLSCLFFMLLELVSFAFVGAVDPPAKSV